MKIGAPMAALVTGAGSGIGQAMAIALARRGVGLSVVDFSEVAGESTVKQIEEYSKLTVPVSNRILFIKCDVTRPDEVASAFAKHKAFFGRLDICINSAGINEKEQFTKDYSMDGTGAWRKVVDVNLIGVIDCTRLAVQEMIKSGRGGSILNVGSAAGLYPSYDGPIYSATKGGVVLFSRSLGFLAKKNVRVNVICPEFVQTEMTRSLSEKFLKAYDGFIPMETFIKGAFQLLEDDSQAGACLWISNRRGIEYWPTSEEKKKYLLKHTPTQTSMFNKEGLGIPVPMDYRKLIVHTLSSNFRAATKVVSVPLVPPKRGHVLVKYLYAGVNASDVNFTAGYYFKNKEEALGKLPFDAGFEGVGIVASVGDGITGDISVGSPVATIAYGSFSEFQEVPAKFLVPIPAAIPEVVPMLVSGLTALLGLEEAGKLTTGETVLVTAAAGGTGQFAVQLAKLAGNKVVATCGGTKKAALLKELGADRVIDYKEEVVSEVLKREYPEGVNLVYESVGGEMFKTCVNALGLFGRLVVIGMVSQYQSGESLEPSVYRAICEKLLWKSQSLVGFYVNHHVAKWRASIKRLYDLYAEGKLKVMVDPTPFVGVEAVPAAVDHLHSGQSLGKVIVQMQPLKSSSVVSKL